MRRREFIALLGAGGGGRTQNLRAQQSATPLVGLQPLLLILMPFRIFQNVITLGCSSLIKNYFNGQLFAGQQTTEFALLQEGVADFAINSTINWSPQVKELNLFSLPFMFPSHGGLDAVQAGEPGKQIFKAIEQKGVIPIAWGENGFRELTNSKRSIRRTDDLHDLTIRVPPVPVIAETFRALGANPVSMNFDQALVAFQLGKVDGQENPISLIIPYKLWAVHSYVTLWHYAIDPLILAVSAKTWATLSPEEDRKSVV